MVHLQTLNQQQDEQQHHTDNTGGEGKGENGLHHLADPADGEDDGDLTDNFHGVRLRALCISEYGRNPVFDSKTFESVCQTKN